MAISRFKHLLAGVICAVAIIGTAQAEVPCAIHDNPCIEAYFAPAYDLCPLSLTYAQRRSCFENFVAQKPEEQAWRAQQRAKQPGPREIPLCVGNCR